MVYKCSGFGCRTGYTGSNTVDENDEKITLHSFPLHDQELCEKWTRANPRKDCIPTKHSKLCSLHFTSNDFVQERRDSNSTRRKRKSEISEQPLRRRLKDDAVPSIFHNCPSYLSSPAAVPRPTSRATSSSRHRSEVDRLAELEQSMLVSDDIAGLTLPEVQQRLQSEDCLPEGYKVTVIDNCLLAYLLTIRDGVPTITGSVVLDSDLAVTVSLDGHCVSSSHYEDVVKGSVASLTQLMNMMARLKSWVTEPSQKPTAVCIDIAVNVLRRCRENMDDDSDEDRKLSFVIEQLQLLSTIKYSRSYSPQLTIMSYMISAASSAAYNVLLDDNVLCLPSKSTLKKVTRRVDSSVGLDNKAYLKLRMSKLNGFETAVLLMIDEIYVAKRVEYSRGDVQGLTSDGSVASTLLCFMIKSLAGKYKDLVAIYPMSKLTAAKLYNCYTEVISLLNDIGFNVIAVSVDNAATNRKFFIDCLCAGNLKTNIVDSVTGQPIFLIFDPVHDLKNVYNNFQSRKIFDCPPLTTDLPHGCSANFKDIVDLHNLEATLSLKKAHRLNQSVLHPKSIEKTSVKLATAVVSESTRDALRYYAQDTDKTSWTGTADFLSLILKLWNIMNVKTGTKGKYKRDMTMDPVRSSMDWKLTFLKDFADFLQRWEDSRKPGLTRETFLALRHTCLALADCGSYMLDRLGFNYVLLGHLQSDAIESRFGWLRQLSGANYFISTRQVLEGDRKIRALSLVKYSQLSLEDVDNAIHAEDSSPSDTTIADSIAEALQCQKSPSASDTSTIYYVSGAVARSVIRTTKCQHCRQELIDDSSPDPTVVEPDLAAASTFLDSIDRGGLSRPSDYTFLLSVHCWQVFEEIKTNETLKAKFLGAASQRSLFVQIMDRVSDSQFAVENYCLKGHCLKSFIAQRLFNCFAKNLVKELSSAASGTGQNCQLPPKKRKIAKLTSDTC